MFLLKWWHCIFFHVSCSGSMLIFGGRSSLWLMKRCLRCPRGEATRHFLRRFFFGEIRGNLPYNSKGQIPYTWVIRPLDPIHWPHGDHSPLHHFTYQYHNVCSFRNFVLLQHKQNHAMRFALRFRENVFAEWFSVEQKSPGHARYGFHGFPNNHGSLKMARLEMIA